MATPAPNAIDITSLPASQLSSIQARLSSEVEALSVSHAQLRSAQSRFRDCIRIIEGGLGGGDSEEGMFYVPFLFSLLCFSSQECYAWEHPGVLALSTSFFVSQRDVLSFFQTIDFLLRSSDSSVLVPLTSSLYVPGRLATRDSVLVDIGTGFYVEKVHDHFPFPLTSHASCQLTFNGM